MKKIAFPSFALIILSVLLISCSDDSSNPTKSDAEFQPLLSSTPQYGVAGTEFQFSFGAVEGGDVLATEGYQYRFDINNDGTYEQDWSASNSFAAVLNEAGEIPIKLDVKSPSGKIGSCASAVNVYELFKIVNTPSSFPGELTWSKDGTNRIAFVWRPNGGGHQIYTVNYPSGTITKLTEEDPVCRHYPEWSPDGKKIAFTYKNTICSLDITSGEYDTLVTQVSSCLFIGWDTANKFLIYNNPPFTATYNIETKEITNFTLSTDVKCLDPTGKLLAYFSYDSLSNFHPIGAKIKIYNLETNQTVNEYSISLDHTPYLLDWSGDGKYIAIGYDATQKNLYILNTENGQENIINVPGLYNIDEEFAWSPDGSILAFPGKETADSDINIYGIKFK